MAEEAKAPTAGPKMSVSGPVGSRNAGEEFIRVDMTTHTGSPFINRKTGFIPIVAGTFPEALEQIKSGKVKIQFGSQTRNGVYNVSLVNPETVLEMDAGVAAGSTDVTNAAGTLVHQA